MMGLPISISMFLQLVIFLYAFLTSILVQKLIFFILMLPVDEFCSKCWKNWKGSITFIYNFFFFFSYLLLKLQIVRAFCEKCNDFFFNILHCNLISFSFRTSQKMSSSTSKSCLGFSLFPAIRDLTVLGNFNFSAISQRFHQSLPSFHLISIIIRCYLLYVLSTINFKIFIYSS